MSLLLDLPCDLPQLILNEWLCFNSLPRLDSAMCTSAWRSRFLHLFEDVNGVCKNGSSMKLLKWMDSKNIKSTVLELNAKMKEPIFNALKSRWSDVTSLILDSPGSVVDMKSFPCLTSLTCVRLSIGSIDGAVLGRLTSLRILGSDFYTLTDIAAIQKHCKQLQSLECVFPPSAKTLPLLLDILSQNEHLRSVLLNLDTSRFDGIGKRPNTLDISFGKPKAFDIDIVGQIIIQCGAFLERIEINWTRHEIRYNNLLNEFFWCTESDYRRKEDATSERYRCVLARTGYTKLYEINRLLNELPGLRKFIYSGLQCIDWSMVLTGLAIEDLSIIGPLHNDIELLKTCRHLKRLHFSQMHRSRETLIKLLDAVLTYRHCMTNQALKGYFDFGFDGGRLGNVYHIEFDGSTFVLREWVSKEYLFEGDSSESVLNQIKNYEEACIKKKSR